MVAYLLISDGSWVAPDGTKPSAGSAVNALTLNAGAAYTPDPGLSVMLDDGRTRWAPTPPPTAPVAGQSVTNLRNGNLKYWRRAMMRVRSKTGRGRIVFLGDSNTCGIGAGTGGVSMQDGAWVRAYPQALANIPNPIVPFSSKTLMGTQNVSNAYPVYDPRVALGTGWASSSTSLGGPQFKFTTGAAGTLSFTPTGPIDSFTVYASRQAGFGTMAINIDGGASLGTINTNGATALLPTTFTVPLGTHTINLVAANDAALYVPGVVAWDSTTPAIDIIQAGWASAFVANWDVSSPAYAPLAALQVVTPDLTVVCLTINDSTGMTDLVAYKQHLQNIVAAAQATGDCLLLIGAPMNNTQAIDGTLDKYVGVNYDIAGAMGCVVVDIKARWGNYAAINPILPYYNLLHPGVLGYQDIAQAVYEVLASP